MLVRPRDFAGAPVYLHILDRLNAHQRTVRIELRGVTK
jgi:hypothetical protein